ncbi:MAG: hypothetical protein QME55_00485 [Brevundimonas sp.]|uniref:hypothetical protein n=1 Tax=Brevundimonas sp. TaxID=1871086 RepID=UPI00262752B7|nr:hypothetical protein [Brevundimonas sp.]MDI6623179.1 hypothetical protein [Brevundimonas sp.]MDQ7811210.1 hypothetical protein [Brevundimonas sp.]
MTLSPSSTVKDLKTFLAALCDHLEIADLSVLHQDTEWRAIIGTRYDLGPDGRPLGPYFEQPEIDGIFTLALAHAEEIVAFTAIDPALAGRVDSACERAYEMGRRLALFEIHDGPDSIFDLANRAIADRDARARGAGETRKIRAENKARDLAHATGLAEKLVTDGPLPIGKTKWTLTLLAEEVGFGWKLDSPRPSAAVIRSMLKGVTATWIAGIK